MRKFFIGLNALIAVISVLVAGYMDLFVGSVLYDSGYEKMLNIHIAIALCANGMAFGACMMLRRLLINKTITTKESLVLLVYGPTTLLALGALAIGFITNSVPDAHSLAGNQVVGGTILLAGCVYIILAYIMRKK